MSGSLPFRWPFPAHCVRHHDPEMMSHERLFQHVLAGLLAVRRINSQEFSWLPAEPTADGLSPFAEVCHPREPVQLDDWQDLQTSRHGVQDRTQDLRSDNVDG